MGRSTTTASILVICCFLMLSVSLCLSSKAKSLLVVCCCWSVFQASFMFGTISFFGKEESFCQTLTFIFSSDTIVWEKTSFAKTFFHLSGKDFLVPKMKEAWENRSSRGPRENTPKPCWDSTNKLKSTNWEKQTSKTRRGTRKRLSSWEKNSYVAMPLQKLQVRIPSFHSKRSYNTTHFLSFDHDPPQRDV